MTHRTTILLMFNDQRGETDELSFVVDLSCIPQVGDVYRFEGDPIEDLVDTLSMTVHHREEFFLHGGPPEVQVFACMSGLDQETPVRGTELCALLERHPQVQSTKYPM